MTPTPADLVPVPTPAKEETSTMETISTPDMSIDAFSYTGDAAKSGESTKLRLRLPSGQNEVITILRDAPLAAIYAFARQKLSEDERGKQFKIIFMNKDIENTLTRSLRDAQISNASLSVMMA